MGPLIPLGVIDSGWSLIIAFVIGIGFGIVLESCGFSSSRKIVGLFYGYDFTVLKVFFTGTVVAMLGLQFLNYFELIDLGMLYFPPTYLKATILGGLMMGLGFIMGGYCPGTSICAVAIGKLDALVMVVGVFIGIFIYSEAFSIIEGLYQGGDLGYIRITEYLNIDSRLFVFIFVCIAVVGFIIAHYVKKIIKPVEY